MSQIRHPLTRIALSLLLCLTLLTGCWDNREVRRRAFVLGLAIDAGEEPDLLEVSAQIPVPHEAKVSGPGSGGGGGGGPQYFLVKGVAPTLAEALQNIQDRVSRALFLGQMRAIVLSDELTPEQVRRVIDGIRTETEIEETVYMAISHGRADRILGFETKLERLPALFFNSVFEAVRRQTVSIPIQYWEFWRTVETSGWEPILPVVRLTEEEEMEVRGMALFRGYELAGFLDGEETQGFLWLMGRTRRRALSMETEDGLMGVRGLSVARTVSLKFEGNKPVFTVHMLVNGEIARIPPGWNSNQVLHRAARLTEALIHRQAKAALTAIQEEHRTDVLGFGKRLFYMYPAYFRQVDWKETFPEVRIQTTVKVELKRKGSKS